MKIRGTRVFGGQAVVTDRSGDHRCRRSADVEGTAVVAVVVVLVAVVVIYLVAAAIHHVRRRR